MARIVAGLVVLALLSAVMPLAAPGPVSAGVVPAGFVDTLFATGFGGRLTTMTWGPGGRLFVSEKQGTVRIIQDGVLLPDAFLTLTPATDSEKGLKGIAFDPDYAANGFVYVYYTDATTIKNRVSRFTRSATNPNSVDPTSELVLVDGIASGIFHSGGALHFGPDGKLYVSTGDGSYAPDGQNTRNLNGKILRINTDGTAPADNPFIGRSDVRPEIWAYGFRNPYTFAFDPGSSRMYINDVGNSTWEEIDSGFAGGNFGWATCEGVCNDPRFVDPIYTYNHADGPGKSITGAVFYRGAMFPSEYAGDFFFGDYVGNYIKRYDPATGQVTDFATDASNPVDLDVGPDGALYYLSVERREIHRVSFGEPPPPPPPPPEGNLLRNGGFETISGWPSPWFWNIRSPAQATLTRDSSIVRSGASAARAAITSSPSDWYVQLNQPNVVLTAQETHTLTFAARSSAARSIRLAFHQNSAPYPVYYERTVPITTDWSTYTLTFVPPVNDSRALLAMNLGGTAGQLWFDDFSLTTTTTVGEPPVPTIELPAAGTTFRANDEIEFQGHATDPEDGELPTSSLTWEVAFHHDDHTHPYVEPFSGQTSGSFVASDTGETSANIWYRILLTARDADGNTTVATRDVRPVTANVTLATQPAGLGLVLDGTPVTTPRTFVGVVGFQRELSAPATQVAGGVQYRFVSWSDGGAATHTIATPASPTTYTAVYAAETTASPFVNGGFDTTGSSWPSPWRLSVRNPARASISRATGSKAAGPASARIDITRESSDWYVQLLQPNIPLVAGTPHTLTFWARASTARAIRIAFQKNAAPYPVYVERRVNITTGWARYDVVFTPTSEDPKSLFVINLGDVRGTVWIDSVSLSR